MLTMHWNFNTLKREFRGLKVGDQRIWRLKLQIECLRRKIGRRDATIRLKDRLNGVLESEIQRNNEMIALFRSESQDKDELIKVCDRQTSCSKLE